MTFFCYDPPKNIRDIDMSSVSAGLDHQAVNRSFLRAASQGDVATMKKCLTESRGACAYAADKNKDTAMHFACRSKQGASIEFLAKKCSRLVRCKNARKETPLFDFLNTDKKVSDASFQALVNGGANFKLSNDRFTPLHSLAAIGSVAQFKQALETVRSYDRDSETIKEALDDGLIPDDVQDIIQSYVGERFGYGQVNKKEVLNIKDRDGHTPLSYALGRDNRQMVHYLAHDPEVEMSEAQLIASLDDLNPKYSECAIL